MFKRRKRKKHTIVIEQATAGPGETRILSEEAAQELLRKDLRRYNR